MILLQWLNILLTQTIQYDVFCNKHLQSSSNKQNYLKYNTCKIKINIIHKYHQYSSMPYFFNHNFDKIYIYFHMFILLLFNLHYFFMFGSWFLKSHISLHTRKRSKTISPYGLWVVYFSYFYFCVFSSQCS